jgi:hypothetical protein
MLPRPAILLLSLALLTLEKARAVAKDTAFKPILST